MLVRIEPLEAFFPQRLDQGRVDVLRVILIASLLGGEMFDRPEGVALEAQVPKQF